jgi:hypothetical protein
MLDGLPFARYAENSKVVSEQVRSRGFYPFSAALASPGFVAHDGKWPHLTIPPILDLFFDRTLAILDERGIEADFIAMPVNQATADAMRRNILGAFSAYLHATNRAIRISALSATWRRCGLTPGLPMTAGTLCRVVPPFSASISAPV